MRKSGILLPVFSLPSGLGMGCFSREAYEFIDKLSRGGQSYWQILPLTPCGKAFSPYAPLSCFAGDPLYIDPYTLQSKGLLTSDDIDELADNCGQYPHRIDYETVYPARMAAYRKAFERFEDRNEAGASGSSSELLAYYVFCAKNAYWLENYSLYAALRDKYDGKGWINWPKAIRLRESTAIEDEKFFLRDEINFHKWMQFEFDSEWQAIKEHAHRKDIEIIGDIPIYASYESADCWTNPKVFKLNRKLKPDAVSGCPPDDYNPDGQIWENPLYDWGYVKRANYSWWIARLRRSFELYDVIRLDHARGFCSYYSIPTRTMKAADGQWLKGPGIEFFDAIREELGDCKLIAEDLGFITPAVRRMIDEARIPSMAVLQFGFDAPFSPGNPYLAENVSEFSVVYTGTHDNDSTAGWYASLDRRRKDIVNGYMDENFPALRPEGTEGDYTPGEIAASLTKLAMKCDAETCIIPLQDYLLLGSESRINTPGTTVGNWQWRVEKGALTSKIARAMRVLTEESGRLPRR